MKYLFLGFVSLFFFSQSLFAECQLQDIIPGEYIVRLKKGPSTNSFETLEMTQTKMEKRGLHTEVLVANGAFESFSEREERGNPPSTLLVTNAGPHEAWVIKSDNNVDSVEPNCRFSVGQNVSPSFVTNDPRMGEQYGLTKIQAPEAWDLTRGSKDIVVAISDTGIDYRHEDLKDNMWVNPNEIPGNRIDDDNNGCIDDIYGCDVANNDGDPMPGNSQLLHGTHVAGIAGATGNNGIGVSGVAQHTKLMAVQAFASGGTTTTDLLLKSIYYSVDNGAKVINCSWGRKGRPGSSERDAFDYAISRGVVMIVAAGNSNEDSSLYSPAGIANVITVAATDSQDEIGDFSNWGTVVDVAAPGGTRKNGRPFDTIMATLPRRDGNYGGLIGTSMAAPFVAGLAALIVSVNPDLGHDDVLGILRGGGDRIRVTTAGSRRQFDYLRINALNSVKIALATLPPGTTPRGPDGSGGCARGADCNNDFSGDTVPGAIQEAFTMGSGCGMINPPNNNGGFPPTGGASMLLLFGLPLMVALRLRFKNA